MEIDLSTLSLRELKELNAKTLRAMESFEARRKQAAFAELKQRAEELNVSLREIAEMARPGRRPPIAPVYRNPAQPDQTWTGRGRRPLWIEAELQAGRNLDDFRIAETKDGNKQGDDQANNPSFRFEED